MWVLFLSAFLMDILQNRKWSRCFDRCHRGASGGNGCSLHRQHEKTTERGGNLQLCSLRSSELELKGFEIVAIKSGRFYFYSCVGAQIQKPLSQTVFLLLWQLGSSLQGLQWLSASSCAKCSICKMSGQEHIPLPCEEKPYSGHCRDVLHGGAARRKSGTTGRMFSGLEKTAGVREGWRTEIKSNFKKRWNGMWTLDSCLTVKWYQLQHLVSSKLRLI